MEPGPVRYAVSGEHRIAFQEFGDGPGEFLFVWGNPNHCESLWEWPTLATFLRGLGRLGRVVQLDQRGCGDSDRVALSSLPSLSERAGDVAAVMDEAGMSAPIVIGESEGAPCAVRFAVEHPDRTSRLVLLAPALTGLIPVELREETLELIESNWGGALMVELQFPSNVGDPRFCDWYSRLLRRAATPAEARAMLALDADVDETATLAEVASPVLVVARKGDPFVPIDELRQAIAAIRDAHLRVIDGNDRTFGHGPGDEEALAAIAEFAGIDAGRSADGDLGHRAVLFTDIEGSTQLLARIGDRAWRRLIDDHDRIMSRLVIENRGTWHKSTGDGMLATFDDSETAVRVALDAHRELEPIGITIRAGVHTGMIETRGSDISGINVNAAARIADHAQGGQTLVSAPTAESLGSGISCTPFGTHSLKGLPEPIPLSVASSNTGGRPNDRGAGPSEP